MPKKRKRDHRFFEQWCRRNGMVPISRVTDITVNGTPVGDILLADSDWLLLQAEFPSDEHRMFGFYRTGFAIDRPGDKTWLASFNDFPPDSFAEYAPNSRQEQRVSEALEYAVKTIEQTQNVGLYSGNSRLI